MNALMDRLALSWKRFEIRIRNAVAQRGLADFRRAALIDGFDYAGISDEALFFGIGRAAIAFYREHENVTPLVIAIQLKVGFSAGDMIFRAVSVAEKAETRNRPFVG